MRRSAGTIPFRGRGPWLAIIPFFLSVPIDSIWAQSVELPVTGRVVTTEGEGIALANILVDGTDIGGLCEDSGSFYLFIPEPGDSILLHVSRIGYTPVTAKFSTSVLAENLPIQIVMEPDDALMEQVVVSGTLNPVKRSESPVPVEVYNARYFQANPAPSVFESLQNINGVRPQLNCNVCNTGDIHMNGLEGPYTMVLIDGMPIVSGLSTVYGLTGIPQSMIERVEIVKGPASTLYGSEAVGGLINVITKDPSRLPPLSLDVMATSWGEVNTDLAVKASVGESATTMVGVNYFNYNLPRDDNQDNFTDVTLQDRLSVFNKWTFQRKSNRGMHLAARYVYEDRWGGELDFGSEDRGSDEVYGESIYTNRWEVFGDYELPLVESIQVNYSLNGHYQNSTYGNLLYQASQQVGFAQLLYRPVWPKDHELLLGAAYRYTRYDDNTVATSSELQNQPSVISLPGLFLQDQFDIGARSKLLLGLRFDLDSRHGSILSPRLNYKWSSRDEESTLRVSLGNGYRVANVFTEDHAALSGARTTVFAEELLPETSWNININFLKKVYDWGPGVLTLDGSVWYTRFGNRILPDYESHPDQIIYANLDGYAISRGGSLNIDVLLTNGLTGRVGCTLQDVYSVDAGVKDRQLLTEMVSAIWSINYPVNAHWSVDYTGNLYGPMELPTLGELDPRPATSPWFSIQNIQITFKSGKSEVYGGVKNLLNYTPPDNSIARPFDPFDRDVTFAPDGSVVPTANNPYGLTFDPTYVFAPNQGMRLFLGVRFHL